MFPAAMSNSTSLSHDEASTVSSCTMVHDLVSLNPVASTISPQQPQKVKKKRNLPGNPDPDAEVIALSPKTLLATNRFVCEICNKGFQRDQNLQLHRRGHNLPWKLKQRNRKEIRKRAYVCPEPTCVHHHPSRALGDLTGIKKHFCRKHGEKKWKCDKCSKIYAVQSDWKAHAKTCGTREYRCDCGILFSRKDSFITHRAFCDALAEESARLSANQWGTTTATTTLLNSTHGHAQLFHLPTQNPPSLFSFANPQQQQQQQQIQTSLNPWNPPQNPNPTLHQNLVHIKSENIHLPIPPAPPISSSPLFRGAPLPPPTHRNLHPSAAQPASNNSTSGHLSATALLQKAATVGAQSVGQVASALNGLDKGAGTIALTPEHLGFTAGCLSKWKKGDDLTRDFLGLTGEYGGGGGGDGSAGGGVDVSVNVRNLLSFTGGVELAAYERDHSLLKSHCFGFAEPPASETWGNSLG